jgi:hypothetical protein
MAVVIRNTIGRLADIPLTDRALMREAGLLARERILRRTRAGRDMRGQAFQPYSAAYASTKAKELGSARVDLTVSGGMLGHLTIVEVTDDKVVLGWAS